MNRENGRPQITSFKDYRFYLKELFAWFKQNKKNFSYEYSAQKLGTSKSYLKQVVDQRIHVDLNRATPISKLFGMNAFEKQYFIVLIIQNQIRDAELKAHFSGVLERLCMNEKVQDLKDYRARIKKDGVQLQDWLSQTIGAMTNFSDFQIDAGWLRKKLGGLVSEKDIKDTVEQMKKSKMIRMEGNRYKESSSHHSPDPFEIDSQRRYIHGALKTIDILSNDFEKHRPGLFFNGALAIAAADYDKVMAAYYKFTQEMIAISESASSPDRVIYISNNIFHVVK